MGPQAARKLKRNVSRETLPVTVKDVKCIRGGKRKRWCVLETEEHMGRECVRLGSTQKWLHLLLAGQEHNSQYNNAINNFISDCIDALKDRRANPAASSQGAALTPIGDAPSASSQVVKTGRAAIFDRDSPSDTESEAKAAAPMKKPRTSNRRASARGWDTISVRGFGVMCCGGRGRQLLVPIGTGDLDTIVQHLLPRADEARREESCIADLLEEDDQKCIAWRKSSASSQGTAGFWQVFYTDEEGRSMRFRSGLTVPRKTLAGETMTAQQQMDAARQVLLRAKREWNRLDRSEADRFPGEDA